MSDQTDHTTDPRTDRPEQTLASRLQDQFASRPSTTGDPTQPTDSHGSAIDSPNTGTRNPPGVDISVLQLSSSRMEFFEDQVRILDALGVDCDMLSYPPGSTGSEEVRRGPVHGSLLTRIYGHNPLYYAIRAADFYPEILRRTVGGDHDLVHLNSGMVAPLGLLQPERPLVLTLWGDDLLGERFGGYQPAITKLCAQRCDRVIVRSEEMRSALPCDAEIIPSGIDMRKFRPVDRSTARNEVGWDPACKYVLFPYPKRREKKRYPTAKQIVGEVQQQFDDPVRLQVVENVPHERMYLYYNAADALLLPSLREGSPNTVKEAMACNVPVVSTKVGDVATRLGPVENSYVCDSDDELADALTTALASDGRSDGRRHVRDVSLERMGERLIDIYESVLEDQA